MLPSKQLQFDTEVRTKLLAGAMKLAHAVRLTMGPKGRNVVLDRNVGAPVITNDGVTIAREVYLEDPFENMGAQLVKEAATKTNDVAGDGTTTATVLAVEFINNGLPLVREGANPVSVKRGMGIACNAVVESLKAMAKKVTTKQETAQVASISSADPEVGEVISEAMEKVGHGGVITVESGDKFGISSEYVEGLQFDSGYISQHMITDKNRMEAIITEPLILITDKRIVSIDELLPIIKEMQTNKKQGLVIIAEEFENDALAPLIVNKINNVFLSLAIKAPGYGDRRKEILQDIATITGGKVISGELGQKLEDAQLADLGHAKKLVAGRNSTIIVGGSGTEESIQERITEIKANISEATHEFDRDKMLERIAKMSNGVAVLKVGAATDVELTEKKHRIEDAISATKAAVEEGIVPGGGMALYYCIDALKNLKTKDESVRIGIDIVRKTLSAPLRQIVENAGMEMSVILTRLNKRSNKAKELGYDADTDQIVNMFEAGIIDPTKVTRSALENAVSIASIFLTTGAAMTDIIPEDKQSK